MNTQFENDLLLCCARTTIDPETAEKINTLIRNNIDWTYLLEKAQEHGVMPLLYKNMSSFFSKAVPEDVFHHLHNLFKKNTQYNLFHTNELLKLLKLFKANGISAIPYKGPVLADSIYGSIALRQFWDLDIIVHKYDILKTKNLLILNGFQPESKMNKIKEALHLRFEYVYSFDRIHDGLHVEIHWNIVPKYISFHFNPDGLWERLNMLPFVNTTVQSLSAETLLLILSVHNGGKHLWQRLTWICDIAEIIRSNRELDWDLVIGQAVKSRTGRILSTGLILSRELLGANLPLKVLREIQTDSTAKLLASQISSQLFTKLEDPEEYLKNQILYLRMRKYLWDKIRYFPYIASKAITPKEKEKSRLPLPKTLSLIHYLSRPTRVLIKLLIIMSKKVGTRFIKFFSTH